MNTKGLRVFLLLLSPVPFFLLCIALQLRCDLDTENNYQDCILTEINTYTIIDGDFAIKRPYTFTGNRDTLPAVKTYTPNSPEIAHEVHTHNKKKHRTIMVYIAADNNLWSFVARNIKQMATIGSNKHVSIVVHLDIRTPSNKKTTRRYLILKEKIIHLNADDPKTQHMDSGNPETLISFCQWATESFPAEEYALILWSHGTGVLTPRLKQHYAKNNGMYNLSMRKDAFDHSGNYFECVNAEEEDFRAICFDDTNKNCLTSKDLQYALDTIVTKFLDGKKLAILGFDACLMSMIEIASLVKPYANIMVGSQEVVLALGYDYQRTLAPLQHEALNATDFAHHIVDAYHDMYKQITNDYTLSAVHLDVIDELEANVDAVAQILSTCLKNQKKNSVYRAIHASKNKRICTHFDEPSFIDLGHFYYNLNENIKLFTFKDQNLGEKIKQKLRALLEHGRALLQQAVLANTTGRNLQRAAGLSIYFPEQRIHSSYSKSPFAHNHWFEFLELYVKNPTGKQARYLL